MTKRMINRKTFMAFSMSIALGLSACGGGGSTAVDIDEVKTGVFIDAPVKGLNYSTSSQSGVTKEAGEFSYKEGEKISFDIDGVNLGEVDAEGVVPVTALPDPLDVARVLQTLDTDAEEGLIDITGVVLPEDVKNDLKAVIEDQTADLDDVFDAADIQAIEGASSVDLINADVVTVAEALDHVEQSVGDISGATFSADDLNRQVYVDIDDEMVISFEEDGTGFEWGSSAGDGQPYREAHTWVLDNEVLTVTYAEGSVDVSLLNQSGNRYDVLVENNAGFEGNGLESIYKALPLSVEMLDGKILAFDTSADEDCTARTIKISDGIGMVKELCTGGYFEDTVTLTNAGSLDNTVWIKGSDDDGNWSIKMHLVEGSISDGKYVFIDQLQNSAPNDVYFVGLTETDKELESSDEKLVWTAEMSNNKTYYWTFDGCPADNLVEKNILNADGTATFEVLEGTQMGTSDGSGSYTHSIDSDGNFVYTDPGESSVALTLQEQTADYYLLLTTGDSPYRFYFEQSKASEFCSSITPSSI